MKRTHLALAAALATVAGGCRGGATPTPTSAPTAEADAGALRVVAPVVNFREAEADPLREVPVGSSVSVAVAANIQVADPGRAELTWPGFLESELLAGADVLVSVAEPASRRVMMDQAAGTARYRVLEGGGADGDVAEFTVLANWVKASVTKAPANLIVSFVPGETRSAWIVAVRGEVSLRLEPDGGSPVMLSEGQGVGVVDGGPIPAPMPVDLPAVETWFSAVAAGTASTSIAPVAMVCSVSVPGALMEAGAADAIATSTLVAVGDMVTVVNRDAAAQWAMVQPEAAAATAGWIPAGSLSCNANLSAFPETAPEAAPTATSTAEATRGRVVVTATAPLVTVTPTGTATLAAVAVIEFSVDDNDIDAGECTNLRWKTSNIDSVYLDGGGVTGEGKREICPGKTTTYTLRVKKRDGSEESRTVEVNVEPRQVVPPTSTAAPPATAITLPTATSEPPTAMPTP